MIFLYEQFNYVKNLNCKIPISFLIIIFQVVKHAIIWYFGKKKLFSIISFIILALSFKMHRVLKICYSILNIQNQV